MKNRKKSILGKELKKYALLTTGAMIAMNKVSLKANIVYTDITDLGPIDFYQLDIDGSGTNEILFYSYYYNSTFRRGSAAITPPLTFDTVIDISSTWLTSVDNNNYGNLTDAYTGVRFDRGTGDLNYGWVRYDQIGVAGGFIIKDYAYETTPNQGIRAGDTGIVAPVELLAFTGIERDGKVILNWKTASELDNRGFDIERSSDNRGWTKIGFISGHGTTPDEHEYSFVDNDQLSGAYYYRLKQIDIDGVYEYSNIISVKVGEIAGLSGITLIPNPVKGDELKISFEMNSSSSITYTLTNMNGQQVQQGNFQSEKGYNELPLQVGDLPVGIYLVRLEQEDGQSIIKRVVIQ